MLSQTYYRALHCDNVLNAAKASMKILQSLVMLKLKKNLNPNLVPPLLPEPQIFLAAFFFLDKIHS